MVLQYTRKLLGIATTTVDAPGQHQKLAENAVKKVTSDIDRIISQGQLKTYDDVEMMCAHLSISSKTRG